MAEPARRALSPSLKKLLGGALVGLLAGAAALLLDAAGALQRIEWLTLDLRQKLAVADEDPRLLDARTASTIARRGPGAPTPTAGAPGVHDAAVDDGRVAVIYQGDASLIAAASPDVGMVWPWPRSTWASVLSLVREDGGRAALFDILFAEPSAEADREAEDGGFARGIARSGGVFLATAFTERMGAPRPAALERLRALAITVTAEDPAHEDLFPSLHQKPTVAIAELLGAARGTGNVIQEPDRDGRYRRVHPLVRWEGRFYPSLALAGALADAGAQEVRITRDRWLVFGEGAKERRLALEPDGTILLRFGAPLLRAHRGAVEAWDALLAGADVDEGRPLAARDSFAPGAFKDKLVFIAYAATGTYDLKPNPLMSVAPAVLVHVAAAQNMVAGRSLRSWTRSGEWPLRLACLALGLVCGALVATARNVLAQVGIALAAGLAWAGLAALVAFPRDLVVDVVAPEAAIVLALTAAALYNYVTEGRRRAEIKSAFQHYISPQFVEELLRDPEKLRLGGEKRELTIFFSDLAGFTTMSERLTPEELVRVLNGYLTRCTRIIIEKGGTLDKYIGDAIMCFYNAPLPLADHAVVACTAALLQLEEIERINADFSAQGLPTVLARMGVNTGEVVVGNMGSEQTMNYTVMGDAVNLASRLEGANKPFGTLTMVGERTRELAAHAIDFRELAGLRVKGKKKPVKVFEILGVKGRTPAARLETGRRFEEGLRLYESRRFAAAASIFEALAASGDEPSKLYLEECRAFEKEPPAADWDGVVTLTSK